MNIDLLTPLVNTHLAHSDTIGKQEAKESALIAINECKVMLDSLREVLKENEKGISVANYLSLCLEISKQTTEIRMAVRSLKTQIQI